jgi:hypothetical protein
MKLTNDSYTIWIGGKTWTERYFRDKAGWVKVSARNRKFRATAEQVLNHVLPALAGVKPNLTVKVEHHALVVGKPEKRGSGSAFGEPPKATGGTPVPPLKNKRRS